MPRQVQGVENRTEKRLALRVWDLKASLRGRKGQQVSQEVLAELRQVCPDVVEEALLKGRGRDIKHRGDSDAKDEAWDEMVARTEDEEAGRDPIGTSAGAGFRAGNDLDVEWTELPFLDEGAYAELFDAAESFVHLLFSWRETVVTGAVFAFAESR